MTREIVKQRLAELARQTTEEVRLGYERTFKRSADSLGVHVMRRRLAYHIQASAYFTLAPAEGQLLSEFAKRDPKCKAIPVRSAPVPQQLRGVSYIREYKGRIYEARAIGHDQFEVDGVAYPSLTACVKAITGQHYSGRKWFRLKGAV